MARNYEIEEMLKSLGDNDKENFEIIKKELGTNFSTNHYLRVLLHDKYDDELCLKAIKAILFVGEVDPNVKLNSAGWSLVHSAFYAGYGSDFIVDLIDLVSDDRNSNKFDVNCTDHSGNSILHTAVSAYRFKDGIDDIAKTLMKYGFNSIC